jgi:hypothetical protein
MGRDPAEQAVPAIAATEAAADTSTQRHILPKNLRPVIPALNAARTAFNCAGGSTVKR